MKLSIKTNEQIENVRTFTDFLPTGATSPGEVLDTLNRFGIDWFITEQGTLMIRYWQIAAEGFVSAEKAAVIRSSQPLSNQGDRLDWLSKNLNNIREQYADQWVAIYGNQVIASALNLPDLLIKVVQFDTPLITFISAEPAVWTFTYAS